MPGRGAIHLPPSSAAVWLWNGSMWTQRDAQVLEPLPADGAFVRAVDAAGRLGVARPEHHHLAVLEAGPPRCRRSRRRRCARSGPSGARPPSTSPPSCRGCASTGVQPMDVEEADAGAQPVAEDAPGVVRAAAVHDRAGPVLALHALDLAGHQVERLVPADALVAGDAAVLRVALAVRVEVHPLHRVEQPVGRVDQRLPGRACAS